jgi:hypothetical protein
MLNSMLAKTKTMKAKKRRRTTWPRYKSYLGPGTPPTRRQFGHEWDRLAYLFAKGDYWLRRRRRPGKAQPFLTQLRALLQRLAQDSPEAGLVPACCALLAEATGDSTREAAATSKLIEVIPRVLRGWQKHPLTEHIRMALIEGFFNELTALRDIHIWCGAKREARAVERRIAKLRRLLR